MCSVFGKCILIFINSLFLLISIALIAVGAILAFVPSLVLEDAYDEAKKSFNNAGYAFPADAEDIEDFPMIRQIGYAFFGFGIVLFVLSFLGCFGSCCDCCRYLLVAFAGIVVILMITEIVVGSLFLVTDSPLHTEIKDSLKDQIRDEYNENDQDNSFSQAMNMIQDSFDCCGMDGVQDYINAGKPKPQSCTGHENVGCYGKLTDIIEDNMVWCGIGLAGLLVLQLLEVIFAVVVYKSASKVSPI